MKLTAGVACSPLHKARALAQVTKGYPYIPYKRGDQFTSSAGSHLQLYAMTLHVSMALSELQTAVTPAQVRSASQHNTSITVVHLILNLHLLRDLKQCAHLP